MSRRVYRSTVIDRQQERAWTDYAERQQVKAQRRRVESVPEWGHVEALGELHRCARVWSADEERRFRELVSDARARE